MHDKKPEIKMEPSSHFAGLPMPAAVSEFPSLSNVNLKDLPLLPDNSLVLTLKKSEIKVSSATETSNKQRKPKRKMMADKKIEGRKFKKKQRSDSESQVEFKKDKATGVNTNLEVAQAHTNTASLEHLDYDRTLSDFLTINEEALFAVMFDQLRKKYILKIIKDELYIQKKQLNDEFFQKVKTRLNKISNLIRTSVNSVEIIKKLSSMDLVFLNKLIINSRKNPENHLALALIPNKKKPQAHLPKVGFHKKLRWPSNQRNIEFAVKEFNYNAIVISIADQDEKDTAKPILKMQLDISKNILCIQEFNESSVWTKNEIKSLISFVNHFFQVGKIESSPSITIDYPKAPKNSFASIEDLVTIARSYQDEFSVTSAFIVNHTAVVNNENYFTIDMPNAKHSGTQLKCSFSTFKFSDDYHSYVFAEKEYLTLAKLAVPPNTLQYFRFKAFEHNTNDSKNNSTTKPIFDIWFSLNPTSRFGEFHTLNKGKYFDGTEAFNIFEQLNQILFQISILYVCDAARLNEESELAADQIVFRIPMFFDKKQTLYERFGFTHFDIKDKEHGCPDLAATEFMYQDLESYLAHRDYLYDLPLSSLHQRLLEDEKNPENKDKKSLTLKSLILKFLELDISKSCKLKELEKFTVHDLQHRIYTDFRKNKNHTFMKEYYNIFRLPIEIPDEKEERTATGTLTATTNKPCSFFYKPLSSLVKSIYLKKEYKFPVVKSIK